MQPRRLNKADAREAERSAEIARQRAKQKQKGHNMTDNDRADFDDPLARAANAQGVGGSGSPESEADADHAAREFINQRDGGNAKSRPQRQPYTTTAGNHDDRVKPTGKGAPQRVRTRDAENRGDFGGNDGAPSYQSVGKIAADCNTTPQKIMDAADRADVRPYAFVNGVGYFDGESAEKIKSQLKG
jgi:hypothetical protein